MCLPTFVCLSVCSLARLLRNACMDLDEMLLVDRCRDMDELINFWARSGLSCRPGTRNIWGLGSSGRGPGFRSRTSPQYIVYSVTLSLVCKCNRTFSICRLSPVFHVGLVVSSLPRLKHSSSKYRAVIYKWTNSSKSRNFSALDEGVQSLSALWVISVIIYLKLSFVTMFEDHNGSFHFLD